LFASSWYIFLTYSHIVGLKERRGVYRVLVRKQRKAPLVRPWHRWEDNIKMDLQEVGCGGVDWIDLVPDRNSWLTLVNVIMNCQVP